MSVHPGAAPGVRDLTGPGVVGLACAALALTCWLDLTDGQLSSAFSVAFILIVVTAPLAVAVESVVTTGVMPPVLMIGALLVIAKLDPSAVATTGLADDSGLVTRTISATLDHGRTLVIGHVLALCAIVLRTYWAARARALRR